MIEPLDLSDSLSADRPSIQGRIRVTFNLDDPAFFYVEEKPASPMVHTGTKSLDNHFSPFSKKIFATEHTEITEI
jgi:hypothetical protein